MAKIVDHDQRRREIVDAYLSLVGEVGFIGASTRELTKHLGVSTGSLWNYFESFTQLVEAAFRKTFAAQDHRLRSIAMTSHGLYGLSRFIGEALPISESTFDESAVAIEFWQQATRYQKNLGAIQGESEARWAQMAATFLTEAQEAGDLREELDPAEIADVLIVVLNGLQMQFTMGTALGTRDELYRVARTAVLSWLTDKGVEQLEMIDANRQNKPLQA